MAMNVVEYLENKGVEKNISWYDGTCYVDEE
jgi:hypothetical protein